MKKLASYQFCLELILDIILDLDLRMCFVLTTMLGIIYFDLKKKSNDIDLVTPILEFRDQSLVSCS